MFEVWIQRFAVIIIFSLDAIAGYKIIGREAAERVLLCIGQVAGFSSLSRRFGCAALAFIGHG